MTQWQANRVEKRSYGDEQIRRWRKNGLTQIAYCHFYEVNSHRLNYWRKRLSASASTSFLVEIPLNRTPHDENYMIAPYV